MTWIAIADQDEHFFDPDGLSNSELPHVVDYDRLEQFLPVGSLVVETQISPDGRPQKLLEYRRDTPWKCSLSLQALPGGGVVLVIVQGDDVFHATVNYRAKGRTYVLRIVYSWDAPRRWGRLSVGLPELEQNSFVELEAPKPLMLADIRDMAVKPVFRNVDVDVEFFAVSNEIEPIGPQPALAGFTPILGRDGYVRVDSLRRGDLVRTADRNLVPVLFDLHRTVPARGGFRPVRLRAPYFGLQQDIIVAPYQRLLIEGSQVEYLFGVERVLVPARHLVNGTAAILEHAPVVVTYSHVILPNHETLDAAGTVLESLAIGRIRRKPDLLRQSLLAGIDRSLLPEHAVTAAPVLSPFDALVLADARAA